MNKEEVELHNKRLEEHNNNCEYLVEKLECWLESFECEEEEPRALINLIEKIKAKKPLSFELVQELNYQLEQIEPDNQL